MFSSQLKEKDEYYEHPEEKFDKKYNEKEKQFEEVISLKIYLDESNKIKEVMKIQVKKK